MKQIMGKLLMMSAALSAVFPATGLAGSLSASPLVTPAWLKAHIHRGDIIVVSINNSMKTYMTNGHVPGARLWNINAYSSYMDLAGEHKAWPSDHDVTHVVDALGLQSNKHIILASAAYNVANVGLTSRAYLILRSAGFRNVSILNGGTGNWADHHYRIDHAAPPKISPSTFVDKSRVPQWIYKVDAVYGMWKAHKTVFVDARSFSAYDQSGHIPGAINAPSSALLENVTSFSQNFPSFYKFKSADELLGLYKRDHIPQHRPIMFYCGSGLLSSEQVFVGKYLLGKTNINYFPQSIRVWTAHHLPTVKGGKPL